MGSMHPHSLSLRPYWPYSAAAWRARFHRLPALPGSMVTPPPCANCAAHRRVFSEASCMIRVVPKQGSASLRRRYACTTWQVTPSPCTDRAARRCCLLPLGVALHIFYPGKVGWKKRVFNGCACGEVALEPCATYPLLVSCTLSASRTQFTPPPLTAPHTTEVSACRAARCQGRAGV